MKKEMNKADKTGTNEMPGEEKQKTDQNRILRNLLIVIGVIVLIVAGYFILSYALSNFTYNGVGFTIVSDEWIPTLYNTKIPVTFQGGKAEYNFYLRNDPRKIAEEVPFNGSLYIRPNIKINYTAGDIECGGDGVIAMANLVNLYKLIETNVTKGVNATCDSKQEYVYINIQASNETSIEETAPACYNMNVNNCEIIKATERYMVETLVELQKYIAK